MNCLRCGRETEQEQVFCASCLKTMEKHPIKPGTAVQIPDRQAYMEKNQPAPRNYVSAEELVPQLRRTIRVLMAVLLALSLSLGVTAWFLIQSISSSRFTMPGNMGRNYTTVDQNGE